MFSDCDEKASVNSVSAVVEPPEVLSESDVEASATLYEL